MKLLVGLGNPGSKYETTRHNVGFLIVDEVASKFGINWSGQKFDGVVARGNVFGQDCLFLKPMTFMNLSGRSVAQAAKFYKIEETDIVVFHDDIDVPVGKVKARSGGGHGGHNGIKSIFAETGLQDFHRIKLGVGRPIGEGEDRVVDWVLGKLSDQELLLLQSLILDEVLVRLRNIIS